MSSFPVIILYFVKFIFFQWRSSLNLVFWHKFLHRGICVQESPINSGSSPFATKVMVDFWTQIPQFGVYWQIFPHRGICDQESPINSGSSPSATKVLVDFCTQIPQFDVFWHKFPQRGICVDESPIGVVSRALASG